MNQKEKRRTKLQELRIEILKKLTFESHLFNDELRIMAEKTLLDSEELLK